MVDPKDIFALPSSGNLKSQSKLIARAIVEEHSKWILALVNDSTMKKTSFTVFGNSPKNTIAQSRYISVFFFFVAGDKGERVPLSARDVLYCQRKSSFSEHFPFS